MIIEDELVFVLLAIMETPLVSNPRCVLRAGWIIAVGKMINFFSYVANYFGPPFDPGGQGTSWPAIDHFVSICSYSTLRTITILDPLLTLWPGAHHGHP